MSSTLFSTLARLLRSGEHLRFDLYRENDMLTATITPIVRSPDKESDDIDAARAALCTALRMRGTPAAMDSTFDERIRGYAEVRAPLLDGYQELLEAHRAASLAVTAAAAKKRATSTRRGIRMPQTSTATAGAVNAPTAQTNALASSVSNNAPIAVESLTIDLFGEP